MLSSRTAVCLKVFLGTLLITSSSVILFSQTVWIRDDFSHPQKGISWKSASGTWKIDSGLVSISTKDYDQLLASSYYAYNLQPFSLEVMLRGIRSGVYFSLDDTTTKRLSHMVRFDEKSILAGYFNGAGEFTATSSFDIPKMPTAWTVLRIDIDPKRKRYEIFVDGISVGTDDHLVFPSGYIGLQASEGLSEFKSTKIFSKDRAKIPSKPRLGSKISFQHISIVQTDGRNVVIYNPEQRLLQTLNPDGKLIKQTPVRQRPKPDVQVTFNKRTYTIRNDKVYVLNEAGSVIDSLYEKLQAPSSIAIDTRTTPPLLVVADAGANVILEYGLNGKLLRTIDGAIIGGFKSPRGFALYGENSLVIADYDKLVFCNPRTDTQSVRVHVNSPTEAEINWSSLTRLHCFVDYAIDGGPSKTLNRVAVRPSGQRTAILRNLSPFSRYSFRVSPTLNTIPEEFSHSKVFRLATPPADSSRMAFTRLPVMCMVYRTISYRDKYPKEEYPQIPDGRTMSEDELMYLRKATESNREFYFRNSSCKIVLDFDFYVVEDTLWLHEVGDTDPYWLAPNERVTRDYEIAARQFGENPEYYSGLICPYAWVNYPPRRTSALRDPSKKDTINIRQAVGGGTNGVPAPWKYGTYSGYTSNPFQDRFSRQDWLITHEFHHQIDALMDVSAYPEYYHADIPWKMPGRFGEDFDFNAHIVRNALPETWLTLKFGTIVQTTDADHDGVPDDDPSLPFDEKRLGGNPKLKDTDGDRLDDLRETMAGSSRGTALNNKDTDGDGLIDGVDPEPLYPISPVISEIARGEDLSSVPFAQSNFDDLHAVTYLRWDDQFLYFRATTDKPANLLIQVDADNDGWFHGFDNFQMRVLNNGDSTWVADYYLRDCSSWTISPPDRRDILRVSDLLVSSVSHAQNHPSRGKEYSVTVKIPRNDNCGLQLEQGKKISVRFGLQSAVDLQVWDELWVWDELFERNYMMQIELR